MVTVEKRKDRRRLPVHHERIEEGFMFTIKKRKDRRSKLYCHHERKKG